MKTLRLNIPWQILEGATALRSLPQRLELQRSRSCIDRADSAEPVLGFGGVLSGGGLIHGGAVKLLSLQSAFQCSDDCFNLLYLVSSAQPPFAEDLVQLCKRRGIPLVWNQNGVGYPAWAGREAERHNAPMRRLRAASDFVVYQSKFCEVSANRFLGPCEVASKILLNPVDLTRFSPSGLPKPLRPLRLLAMGTQNYAARVNNVIDALAELQRAGIDASLTIAGRLLWKDAESEIAGHAVALGVKDSVFRVGAFTQEMAVSLYRSHHLLVHPKFRDPCPTVVAEALACGLPVVASNSGGLPEMVGEGCGHLISVPENDWSHLHTPSGSEIAQAILSLLPRIEESSKLAREHATRLYCSSRWVDSHKSLFQAISGC